MRSVLTALLLLATTAALPAEAADALHARVVGMLSAIESLPERSAWQDLGPPCVPVLVAIANDPQQPTFRRARALAVLGYFDDPAAADALESLAANERAEASLRRHALLGLGRAAPERALPHLARALESDDSAMRQVAIKALGESSSPTARSLLLRRRDREQRSFLVQQIEAALSAAR